MSEAADFGRIDWGTALDPARAVANVETDAYGDWYRDPWGWPEFRWLKDRKKFAPLLEHAARGTPTRLVAIDVPKPGFGSRPAVVMSPLDRLLYQAIVDRMSVSLIGSLPLAVYGWRLPPKDPKPGIYSKNNLQWQNYTAELGRCADKHSLLLETDVVSCFASMDPERIMSEVRANYSGFLPARLETLLLGWKGVPGRRGLPQRCQASSVLANFYLRPLDDVLAGMTGTRGDLKVLRWMDDISVFGDREGRLRALQLELSSRMRDLGIEMNQAKTRVAGGVSMKDAVQQLDLKVIDYGLSRGDGPTAVDPLFEEIIAAPSAVARTRVRFLCKRLRDHRLFDRVGALVSVASQMPHAADDLGRLFSDANLWSGLQDWFVEYLRGEWNLFDWAAVGLGTMLPTATAPSPSVVDAVVSLLESRKRGLLVAAFASQRLASWNADAARFHLLKAAESAQNGLERRCFGYAALAAGVEASKVRSLLGDFQDSRLFLEYLEDHQMNAPKVTKDYSGDADPF